MAEPTGTHQPGTAVLCRPQRVFMGGKPVLLVVNDEGRPLAAGETIYEPNPYGPEPTPTHAKFFADAECHLRLEHIIDLTCPVRLIHGKCDEDVPWEVSLKLKAALRSDDVQVTLIEDGDHRLSRDSDIAALKAIVAEFYG